MSGVDCSLVFSSQQLLVGLEVRPVQQAIWLPRFSYCSWLTWVVCIQFGPVWLSAKLWLLVAAGLDFSCQAAGILVLLIMSATVLALVCLSAQCPVWLVAVLWSIVAGGLSCCWLWFCSFGWCFCCWLVQFVSCCYCSCFAWLPCSSGFGGSFCRIQLQLLFLIQGSVLAQSFCFLGSPCWFFLLPRCQACCWLVCVAGP